MRKVILFFMMILFSASVALAGGKCPQCYGPHMFQTRQATCLNQCRAYNAKKDQVKVLKRQADIQKEQLEVNKELNKSIIECL